MSFEPSRYSYGCDGGGGFVPSRYSYGDSPGVTDLITTGINAATQITTAAIGAGKPKKHKKKPADVAAAAPATDYTVPIVVGVLGVATLGGLYVMSHRKAA